MTSNGITDSILVIHFEQFIVDKPSSFLWARNTVVTTVNDNKYQ